MTTTAQPSILDLETTAYKILVSDALVDAGLKPLQAADHLEVDVRTDLSPDELIDAVADYEALIVRSGTQVTAQVIEAGKKLRVIARAGVGVDNIDVEAATRNGIIVVNAPTGNTVAAAEHTIAMLMSLARNIPQAHGSVQAGEWKRSQFTGVEVSDKVLGLVGLGRVAQEVARRAQGLEMKVIAYDPYITEEYARQRGVQLATLDEVIQQADFLTLHVPLTDGTRNLIDAERLSQMKQGVRLLNVARGGIVDEQALVDAINAGKISGAAIDVFDPEPLVDDNPMRNHPQIILTPHLGASTIEAQHQVAEDVALQVLDVLNDRPARYAVNAPIIPPNELDFLVPYIELAERMGSFIEQLGAQSIRELEITAYGELADYDLTYLQAAAIKGLFANAVQMRINLVNASLIAEKRGVNLIERKRHQHRARYETMLTLRATSPGVASGNATPGEQRWSVCGAMINGIQSIVAMDDVWVDFPAQGNLIVSSHEDSPGIIGQVGTILGQSDVNISFMHVGRHGPRTSAIMVLGTDEVAPPDLVEQLNTIDNIYWLTTITL